MPASPWRNFQQPKPEVDYLVQLSYLPLVRYRSLVSFSRWLVAIQRQLRQTNGIIGYSLLAHPFERKFWTLSIWLNKAALNSFFRSAPHVEAMKALRQHMGQTRFIEWTMTGSALPPTWDDALNRFYRSA
jgi:heme-degrading monooxygenase HmoA